MDRRETIKGLKNLFSHYELDLPNTDSLGILNMAIAALEKEDAEEQGLLVRLPCKIGDTVWGIRAYKGTKHPQQGIVSEMYFLPDMSLQIVIKHVCRGKFGETVFLTREEAEQALRGMGSE